MVNDIICLISGRNLFDSNQYLFDPKIFCFIKTKHFFTSKKMFYTNNLLIQSNILSECSTFDGNPPQPLMTISKLKELHQSNSKSTIQKFEKS